MLEAIGSWQRKLLEVGSGSYWKLKIGKKKKKRKRWLCNFMIR